MHPKLAVRFPLPTCSGKWQVASGKFLHRNIAEKLRLISKASCNMIQCRHACSGKFIEEPSLKFANSGNFLEHP